MRKNMLKLLVGSLCLSAFIGIVIILIGTFGEIESKVLATTLLIFGYSIPGLCLSTIYEKDRLRSFSIIGMLVVLITCLYTICLVWGIFEFDFLSSIQWKIILSLNLLCCSSGHISLILLINNKNNLVLVFKNLTVLFSIIIDIMILLPLWDMFDPIDFYYRLMWVLGILITLGTIGTPILNKIYKSREEVSDILINTDNNQNIEPLN